MGTCRTVLVGTTVLLGFQLNQGGGFTSIFILKLKKLNSPMDSALFVAVFMS